METKYVKFSGGNAVVSSSPLVSMSGGGSGSGSGSGFVSMKGLFSTSQPLEFSTQPIISENNQIQEQQESKEVNLELKSTNDIPQNTSNVASESRPPRKPRRMMECVSSGALSVSDSNSNETITTNNNEDNNNNNNNDNNNNTNLEPTYEMSSDGGMMFSTG